MIAILVSIALKSLLIAGLALGLLALLRERSAAERSWIAHIGLLALIVLAFAPLALPRWSVEAPALFARQTVATPAPSVGRPNSVVLSSAAPAVAESSRPSGAAMAAAGYAIPAALLLLVTLVALFRLIALRARADVVVDGHWLSALARAQRRMGFKHGTALLTSNDLNSPISWGVLRPVILLTPRAIEAPAEAEAIIAHELAHVARLDWAKLLLARVATALFWFNPLVWLLAREAHQLREEAADDAVLAVDIKSTDYAQLLVGVARHECPGLLLGAHGVAPSKNSLARRVTRVLDAHSARGPMARSFAWGVLSGAVLVAAPLAALTITPHGAKRVAAPSRPSNALAETGPDTSYYAAADLPRADLANIIAGGVTTAVEAVATTRADEAAIDRTAAATAAVTAAQQVRASALAAVRNAPGEVSVTASDKQVRIDRATIDPGPRVSVDYVASMRAASAPLRSLDPGEFVGMHALGVTPEYVRALAAAGLRDLDEEALSSARAVGVTPEYARALTASGLRPNIDDYVELRAIGIPASYVAGVRSSGGQVRDADQIIHMWTLGSALGAGRRARSPPSAPSNRALNDEPDD